MKKAFKVLLPIAVIIFAVIVSKTLLAGKQAPDRKAPPPPTPVVEVAVLQPQNYQLSEHSRGTVQPRTQGNLVAQVGGNIIRVANNFRPGGFFKKGEELLRIDPRDYQVAVTIAESELAQAKLALADEQARSDQALRDWQRLGLDGQPSELTLRKPQLAGARATVAAAEARLTQAKLNLERARVVAPYAGRVLTQTVDVGQFVSPGTILATIYASDALEVRLPLSSRQLAQIEAPRHYRDGVVSQQANTTVTLSADAGNDQHWQWPARLVRTEGAVDASSRQIFVVAQVDDPYARDAEGRPPLKVGQFVEAEIAGRDLEGVYVLPRSALHEPDQAWIVNADNQLQRQTLSIAWRGTEVVIVSAGLQPGDRVVTSALALATDGTPVRIAAEESSQ